MSLFHKEIVDGLYHIGDGRGNFCTLVTGECGAVLFDTMLGFDDLKGYAASLTPHEPMVINSHCHFDHAGGNHQFARIHMSREEFPLLELAHSRIPVLTHTLDADLSSMECCYTDRERISVVEPEAVIDLGGMTVKVVALPGHTPGSIGLLVQEHRLLLAGDALSPQYCIFFRESLPLARSKETLDMIQTLPVDHFLSAHFDILFPAKYVQIFRDCLDLPGKKRGMDYDYPILPEEKGKFFVLNFMDREINQLIGAAVKEEDAPVLTKPVKKVK
jgi:glyoxylase-like metal-dependent hydrolase (beta-lactamase superfamily II)